MNPDQIQMLLSPVGPPPGLQDSTDSVQVKNREPAVKPGEDFRLPGLVEAENLVVVGARAFHAGRSHRHARDRETRDFGLFLEQARDICGGHVTLDDVSVDDPGVTRAQVVGNSESALDLGHPGCVLGVDTITVLDEMLDPALATAAARVLVDGDGRLLRYHFG